jgi:hypothetical protein
VIYEADRRSIGDREQPLFRKAVVDAKVRHLVEESSVLRTNGEMTADVVFRADPKYGSGANNKVGWVTVMI